MWSQSVSVFDPYAAIMDASEETESSSKHDSKADNE